MVREIVKDESRLSVKAEPATTKDRQVITDLKDTLRANRLRCVGMAANMIGVNKQIIIFSGEGGDRVMVNPKIAAKQLPYEVSEGCLSLKGERPAVRYRVITVDYLDENFRKRRARFEGFEAQVIQHECDHLEGIII
ncbi:MAG: peptide deformylase [Ruminococcus sp.]|nr:peptide deformylase [Ruminococcus sp.]